MKKSIMKTIIEAMASELEFTKSFERASNEQVKYLEELLAKTERERDHAQTSLKIANGIIERQAEDYGKLQRDNAKKKAPLTEEQMRVLAQVWG